MHPTTANQTGQSLEDKPDYRALALRFAGFISAHRFNLLALSALGEMDGGDQADDVLDLAGAFLRAESAACQCDICLETPRVASASQIFRSRSPS